METRQLILIVLMQSDLNGIRVGGDSGKDASDQAVGIPSSADIKKMRELSMSERKAPKISIISARMKRSGKRLRI